MNMSNRKSAKSIISSIAQVIVWPIGVYLIFFILCRVLPGAGAFGSVNSVKMVLTQAVPTTMMAWAMSGNMMSKRWDFSVGNMMILTCLLGVGTGKSLGFGPWGMMVCILFFGTVFGLVNGILYVTLKIPMLLISVGMMKIYEFIGYIYNKGQPAELRGSKAMFGHEPWIFILLVVMGLVYYMVYSRSSFGRNYYALRDGQAIAVNNNIDERRNTLVCFLILGIFVGMAAVCYSGMSGIVESSPTQNNSMNLMCNAFAPIFMGRYLSKHINITAGIFIGTLTMKLLTSGIIAVGLPSPMQSVASGAFLILFMGISANQDRMDDWAARKTLAAQIQKATTLS